MDGSLKLKKWDKKNIIYNVIVYLINIAVIIGLFAVCVVLNAETNGQDKIEVLSDNTKLIHFITLVLVMIGVLFLYLYFEDKDFLREAQNSEMLFLIIELGLIISFLLGKFVSLYLRPLALPAILTMYLSNRKTAVFTNLIFCTILFLFDAFINTFKNFADSVQTLSFLVMGLSVGVVSVFFMFNVYSRFKLLLRGLIASLPTLICLAVSTANYGIDDVFTTLICGFFSGPLAVVLFTILLPFMEIIFKRISCFKFAELTDHKSPLVKKLITEAPGTFNHSIVVSNIAEACATAIGEDALLARTCAYYHDMGKLRRPEFFKENQADGVNPHDDLTPELSTNIIKSHTEDGYKLMIKNGLPKELADVCREHHGTMPILYFYDKAKKFTDGKVDINKFCYSGPKPQTKIAAIIMIADGSEAAARTLKDRSRENVEATVRKIVDDRMTLGQFDECEITLKELNIIIHTVVNNLTGVYHNRIQYPKINLDKIERAE